MSDLMREEFEKRFPVPFNADWSYEIQRYVWNEKDNSLSAAMEHNKIFEAWQVSRECLVIEPEWPDHYIYTNPDCAGAAILDCRSAFNVSARAAGVKTK